MFTMESRVALQQTRLSYFFNAVSVEIVLNATQPYHISGCNLCSIALSFATHIANAERNHAPHILSQLKLSNIQLHVIVQLLRF